MLLDVKAYLNMYKDHQLLAASLSVRFPTAIPESCLMCAICQDEDVVDGTTVGVAEQPKVVATKGAYSIYEQFICQGTGCAPGSGGVSWLCERCALVMEIKEMIAKKKFLANIKRNMVCQCPWGSPALVTTYVATERHNYKLDASAQYGGVIDGPRFFAPPSMQEIVADPSVLVRHMLACRKMTAEGELVTTLTFNADNANAHNVIGCRLSVQCLWDEEEDTMSVIACAPVSEAKITPVGRTVTKGATTRGGGGSKKARLQGTSSEDAFEDTNTKSTGNVIKFAFPFRDTDGTEEPAELVFEGVLPPGTATGLMQRLRNGQTTEPSFCPIRTISEIATCVSATSPEDAEHRQALLGILDKHSMQHKVVGDKIVVLNIDTGTERIFKSISESLTLCGFGERADKWDWHVVVLRRGRYFLTLYILVVHAPSPGLWVIAERLTVGETVETCTTKTIMVGQDVSGYSHVESGQLLMERGNWGKEYMKWYIGFSAYSNALETCVNRELENTGPLLHELVEEKLLTMQGVFAGIIRQKNLITAALAAEDVGINNTFIAKISAQHEAQQKLKGIVAPAPYFPGTTVSVGVYGDIRVVTTQHEDSDDEEGELISTVTMIEGAVPEMVFEIPSEASVSVQFIHKRGVHPDMVMCVKTLHVSYAENDEDEDHFDTVLYNVNHWTHNVCAKLCRFDTVDTRSFLLLRDPDTQQTIIKMRFNNCPN